MSIERFDRVAALTLAHYKVTGPLHVVCKCDACAKTPNATVAHYSLQLALAERDKARADCAALREALRALYEDDADYIRLNHLGPVDHNHCMSQAHIILARLEAESKP